MNKIETRARQGQDENEMRRDEKRKGERERNWIEGKSRGIVLLLTWRGSYYNCSINTRSLGTMDRERHVGTERGTLI